MKPARVKIWQWISILALLLNAMLPYYAVSSPLGFTEEAQSVFGDKILICTKDGYKWVSPESLFSDEGSDIDSESLHFQDSNYHNSHHNNCPLCFASASADQGFIAYQCPLVSANRYHNYHGLGAPPATQTLYEYTSPSRAPPFA